MKVTLSSVPTGRAAYLETRKWLLKEHGPICAYCARTFPPATLTLDHVTPRRGQTAYDRRDNLVLCCKACNSAKADKPFLVWVLHNRERARHLFSYGQHLSDGILDMLRPMVGEDFVIPPKPVVAHAPRKHRPTAREVFGPLKDDGASPYLDDAPVAPALPHATRPAGRARRGKQPPKPPQTPPVKGPAKIAAKPAVKPTAKPVAKPPVAPASKPLPAAPVAGEAPKKKRTRRGGRGRRKKPAA